MAETHRDFLTIGEVVESLSDRYPDLSISKVRFLEDEGLVSPERTGGGYRKFHPEDVARIELVLRLQKEHFMPLAVIREKLKDADQGRVAPELIAPASHNETLSLPLDDTETVPVSQAPDMLGLPTSFVKELADFGLVALVKGDRGDEIAGADIAIAHACWDLRKFGIEPRHLRMYEIFAEKEATFFSQALMPGFRHRTPEVRQKLMETLNELMDYTGALKRSMLHRALARVFDDVM